LRQPVPSPDHHASTAQSSDFLFPEPVNYVAAEAFKQITGDRYGYREATKDTQDRTPRGHTEMGENFDFDDPEQMRRRLPRLANMFLEREP
jgi:hypothetical protein